MFSKIVILTQNSNRSKKGNGVHEYYAGARLLANILNHSGLPLNVTVHHGNWTPLDRMLDGVSSIVVFSDGGGDQFGSTKKTILSNMKQFDTLITNKKIGVMFMHYAIDVDKGSAGNFMKKWIGGHYETGWSANPYWEMKSELNKAHPICNGVNDFTLQDEWCINLRFRDNMSGIINILQGTPSDEVRRSRECSNKPHLIEMSGRKETLMWVVQQNNGSRGAGFSGGHFYHNWKDINFCTLVLNAICWVSSIPVPKKGIFSKIPKDKNF